MAVFQQNVIGSPSPSEPFRPAPQRADVTALAA